MENSLQIKNNSFAPALTKLEIEIIEASREPQISALREGQIAQAVSEAISNSIVSLNGSKWGNNERALVETQIIFLLKANFPYLTLSEFKKAMFMGTMGMFKNRPDDIVFLSVSNISQWLTKYKSEVKTEAMKKQIAYEAKQEEVDKETKIKEASKVTKELLISEFQNFIDGLPVYDPINILYDWMDSRGLVRLSIERKKDIFEQAKIKYKAEYSHSKSLSEHVINRKIMQEIEAGTDRVEAMYKLKAKQLALIEIFKDIKGSGMSINDYLELNGF